MRVWIVGLCLALSCTFAQAQSGNEARLREALRDTAVRLRDAEAALAQQKLAVAALEQERDALKKTKAAPPRQAVDDGRLQTLQKRLQEAQHETVQARSERQQTDRQMRQLQTERDTLQRQLGELRRRSDDCGTQAQALYDAARELAALYRDPEFVRFVRKRGRELIGLQRVGQENRVRALEDRIDELHAQSLQCRNVAVAAAP